MAEVHGGVDFRRAGRGDITGDGKVEVVAITREGTLFAWSTPAWANQTIQWKGFHHDARNMGNYHTPLPVQEGPFVLCGAPAGGGTRWGLSGLLAGLALLGSLVAFVKRAATPERNRRLP